MNNWRTNMMNFQTLPINNSNLVRPWSSELIEGLFKSCVICFSSSWICVPILRSSLRWRCCHGRKLCWGDACLDKNNPLCGSNQELYGHFDCRFGSKIVMTEAVEQTVMRNHCRNCLWKRCFFHSCDHYHNFQIDQSPWNFLSLQALSKPWKLWTQLKTDAWNQCSFLQ